jgi:ABC-type nickel/cobalt efflux system permease component RcnA
VSEASAILSVIGSVAIVLLLLFMLNHRRLRKKKLLILMMRVIACVLIQIAAILIIAEYVIEPYQERQNVEPEQQEGLTYGAEYVTTLLVVFVDVIAIIFVALYKSDWVEPLLR